MRRRLTLLATLLLLAACGRPAAAYTWGDTLTVIWRPLPNVPAFAVPGGTLPVWARAPAGATGWSASLMLGSIVKPLTYAGGSYESTTGTWSLSFTLPDHVPEEVFDLALASSATSPDTARHAVKVLPEFKSAFYFAQVTDTHLPSHVYSSDAGFSVSDTSGMADFDAVIDDLNFIHPEFVLHTGDVVNEGELESYLSMYEMGRAQAMISRLRDPMFLVSGNHDVGGWDATAPPAGTARKNWWRTFGWPALASAPAGYPFHSQVYSFDYGLVHCVGMEGYENSGGYDDYLPAIYGSTSMTDEEMDWLTADVAAVPAGHGKLAFIHYDYQGQFDDLASLGLDGVIWGHDHTVAEVDRTAVPFDLGLASCIDSGSGGGGRAFRLFRVANGVITPGPRHNAGGTTGTPTDSLTITWGGANDGTRCALTAQVVNRYGEDLTYGQLVFHMPDHDSSFAASRGVVTQTLRHDGLADVYVTTAVGAGRTLTTTVSAVASVLDAGTPPAGGLWFEPPWPNPLRSGSATLEFGLPMAGTVHAAIYDVTGRLVATLFDGHAEAGEHRLTWSGRSDAGEPVGAGLYFAGLRTPAGARQARIVVLR
jgi:hypothetical protein